MLVALMFNLTLLPVLIIVIKPLGQQDQNNGAGVQPGPSSAITS
ncbi:MAG: hypothetical protein VYC17_01565 [Nitrospinota bacterium]|nr:hypothetical protein [Nitrospinota bacterium]